MLKLHTTAHWLAVLRKADVPAMVCRTLQTLPGDEHLQAVGLLQAVVHPQEGAATTIRPSILLDGSPAPPGAPTEHLGWSTRAVLAEAGLAEEAIAALLSSGGALDGQAPPPGAA